MVNKEERRADVFVAGHPFKVIATLVDGEYRDWKFAAKDKESDFFMVGPHFIAGKGNNERDHYDKYSRANTVGKLNGFKPPKFAGMIIRNTDGMIYPMLNGYICVSGYGPNGEHGFVELKEFNRRRRLYKVIQRNTEGQPILVSRIRLTAKIG